MVKMPQFISSERKQIKVSCESRKYEQLASVQTIHRHSGKADLGSVATCVERRARFHCSCCLGVHHTQDLAIQLERGTQLRMAVFAQDYGAARRLEQTYQKGASALDLVDYL